MLYTIRLSWVDRKIVNWKLSASFERPTSGRVAVGNRTEVDGKTDTVKIYVLDFGAAQLIAAWERKKWSH